MRIVTFIGFSVSLLTAAPVWAADTSAGKAVDNAAVTPSGGFGGVPSGTGRAPDGIGSIDGASRDLVVDPAAAARGLTVIRRSRDGQETRIEPGEEVLKAIRGERKSEGVAPKGAADPVAEAERAVTGSDDRIRVTDSKKYPFAAVGMLQSVHSKSGTTFVCTATLIAPKTIVTAASCIFNHQLDGGWFDKIAFYPGINGENDVPFGEFVWVNAGIFDCYISNYNGSYASISVCDIAVIELEKAAGETVGWLGYENFDLGDFSPHMIGYQNDKDLWTQWRTTCDVILEQVRELAFDHNCDNSGLSVGAPMYFYVTADKTRRIAALNMGDWALRISEPLKQWLVALAK